MIDRTWYDEATEKIAVLQPQIAGAFPHYVSTVPKDLVENSVYRQRVRGECQRDADFRKLVWQRCAADALFYINTFVYIFNPRDIAEPVIPMITYPFQDWVVLEMVNAIRGGYPLRVEKSRDQGLSYLSLLVPEWFWHFQPRLSFLFASRKEDLVDKPKNYDALFPKIDFVHEHMPAWLLPPGYLDTANVRTHMHIFNPATNSVIDGESTNHDLGRAGRRTAAVVDEHAFVDEGESVEKALLNVSDCRIYVSTPSGDSGSFYDLGQGGIRNVTVHWTLNPVHALGLEWRGGKPWSPWYQKKCNEATSRQVIAQELDLDYHASVAMFFDADLLHEIRQRDVRFPLHTGFLELFHGDVRFVEDPLGPLRLWAHPAGGLGPAEPGPYGLGADVAMGSVALTGRGASNSVLSGVNLRTGEKICEYATAQLQPAEFAADAVRLGRWLGCAQLIWEDNGPGIIFGQTISDLAYSSVYFRHVKIGALSERVGDLPGWHSNAVNKRLLLGNYQRALRSGIFINRSLEAVRECASYSEDRHGSIQHNAARTTVDPTGARENHGDRVIADALANEVLRQTGFLESARSAALDPSVDPQNPPEGSFAWRRKLRQRVIKGPRVITL